MVDRVINILQHSHCNNNSLQYFITQEGVHSTIKHLYYNETFVLRYERYYGPTAYGQLFHHLLASKINNKC